MRGMVLAGLGYRYPSGGTGAVAGVDLAVAPGEIVLVTGPTGCGKSTLVRLVAGLLQRHGQGQVTGRVRVEEEDPATLPPARRVRLLGLVGQEPGDQLVAETVADELAFAMESAGMEPERMDAEIGRLLSLVGLDVEPERSTRALSGGQQQRLVTAAALSAGASCLLLDEPIAQLDPEGAHALLGRLRAIADGGAAMLMVEHRLEACLPFVDRVVVMDGGRVVAEAAPPLRVGHPLLPVLRELGLDLPGRLDLEDRLAPRSIDDLRLPPPSPPPPPGAVVVELAALRFRHEGAERDCLDLGPLRLHRGERVALVGANGAGKSTLLDVIGGRRRVEGCRVQGRVVAVPQDPDLALFLPTVRAELAYGPQEARVADVEARVGEAAAALSIADLLDRAPQSLSRGQRLRVAVAAAAACRPDLLLLDEPTSGQDHDQVERMLDALGEALGDGLLLFATHDLGLALRHATRVLVLDRGRLVADGPPAEVLADPPPGLPLRLPSLAALCLERGWPCVSAAQLVALGDSAATGGGDA
ncbi:MAG: ATP-binding cassette domain-containing protein [Deltaproteobacteria bacterium]|nr:MAG: ATP-binding cassette domain-containing protein [Deltaproteobacteria bacterium]